MPPKIEESLRRLPEKLLVGVSGGLDSVALLHMLVTQGYRPVVLHFDHGWRPESGIEADEVRKLARELALKFVGAKQRKTALPHQEAAARAARYAFFSRTAQRLGIRDLVLAHHADDQVETFLLQLLRGSGAAARGMDPLTERAGLILHRPWLGVWRAEILQEARKQKWVWRDDPTNRDVRHRRNLIRHRVLPYLQKQISPAVAENLWRAAEITRAEGEWLDRLCAEAASKAELSVASLRSASLGEQRRVILRWLQQRGVANVSFADVKAVRNLLEQPSPAKINLSRGKFARRRSGKIFLE